MRNKVLGTIVWAIGLAMSLFILFFFTPVYGAVTWITLGFTLVAFISQLILWFVEWQQVSRKLQFLIYPILIISVIYLLIQLGFCFLFSFASPIFSAGITVMINLFLCLLMWLILIMVIIARNVIKKAEGRQKDHHIEL